MTSAAYLPSGPLTTLALGNGVTESRSFDTRYFPAGISAGSALSWTYTTDSVGNILQIADSGPGQDRTYTYQDTHYFLTSGTGPWGSLSWSYDKIGNRLTETRDGVVTNYAYTPSATGGRSPKLSAVGLGTDEEQRFFFDPAGNETYQAGETTKRRMSYDALGRMSQIKTDSDQTAGALLSLSYDGPGGR